MRPRERCFGSKLNGHSPLDSVLTYLLLLLVVIQGQTPLHTACSIPNINIDVVRTLIAGGANVNEADTNGWTALHCTFPLACAQPRLAYS